MYHVLEKEEGCPNLEELGASTAGIGVLHGEGDLMMVRGGGRRCYSTIQLAKIFSRPPLFSWDNTGGV